MEKDNNKLVKFIEDDNKQTTKVTKEADDAMKERKAIEVKIKTREQKINGIMSDIDKNIDQLSALEDHKKFLFSIFRRENAMWVEKVE